MQLIGEIIELLSDQKSSLQGALLKAQVLAHKLANQELATWVEHELRGYPEDSAIPKYRLEHLSLFGHVTNGVHHYQSQTLPTIHLSDLIKKRLTQREVRESVSTLENWLDSDKLAITIPAEACQYLSEPFADGYFVQQAWGKFSVGAIDQMLVQIRSRLLEFCLRIAEDFPAELTNNEIREKATQIDQNNIFRHVVFGDNATVLVGAGSISHISNKIQKGNWEDLAKYLSQVGVTSTDIDVLKKAIEEDQASDEKHEGIGSKVRQWMANVITKAGTGAWKISIGVASNLISKAIEQYYGIGG